LQEIEDQWLENNSVATTRQRRKAALATPGLAGRKVESKSVATVGEYGWRQRLSRFFVAFGFVFFRSTGQDDSYISYWPAHALAHYGRIINYSGEQSSRVRACSGFSMLGSLAFLTRAPVPLLGPAALHCRRALAIVMASPARGASGPACVSLRRVSHSDGDVFMYWSLQCMESSFAAVMYCLAWLWPIRITLAGLRTRKIEIVLNRRFAPWCRPPA